jgi:hypothetical protein
VIIEEDHQAAKAAREIGARREVHERQSRRRQRGTTPA